MEVGSRTKEMVKPNLTLYSSQLYLSLLLYCWKGKLF